MSAVTLSPPAAFDGGAIHADRVRRDDYLAGLDTTALPKMFSWKEDMVAGNADILALEDSGGDGSISPAWLCVIGTIVPDRPHLRPHGNYSANYNHAFKDAKLQFTLATPSQYSAQLAEDFDKAIEHLHAFQRLGGPSGVHKYLLMDHRGKKAIRLSFPLFSLRDGTLDPNDPHDHTLAHPVEEEFRQLLTSTAQTHSINPLPFYDHNDKLMQPDLLDQQLLGAVVEVWFTLHHWAVKQKNGGITTSDTFVGRVAQLRVLRKTTTVVSPFRASRGRNGPYIPPSRPQVQATPESTHQPATSNTSAGPLMRLPTQEILATIAAGNSQLTSPSAAPNPNALSPSPTIHTIVNPGDPHFHLPYYTPHSPVLGRSPSFVPGTPDQVNNYSTYGHLTPLQTPPRPSLLPNYGFASPNNPFMPPMIPNSQGETHQGHMASTVGVVTTTSATSSSTATPPSSTPINTPQATASPASPATPAGTATTSSTVDPSSVSARPSSQDLSNSARARMSQGFSFPPAPIQRHNAPRPGTSGKSASSVANAEDQSTANASTLLGDHGGNGSKRRNVEDENLEETPAKKAKSAQRV